MIFHAIDGARARRFLFSAIALLFTAAFALTSAAGASASTYANFNRVTYAYSTTWSTSQEANTYQVMLMQASDAAMVPLLKAANPNLKILAYQASSAVENTSWAYNSCMPGPWVLANHPSWILKDQYGNPILYQNHYLTDVGNVAYQQACLANAVAMARADGFDGVYWDMVNAKLSWTLPPGTSVPEYPTDASWQAAMYSMLTYAGSQLHANGLMNVANIGGDVLFPGLWAQWNTPLDGAEEEGFTNNKQGTTAALWALPKQLADVSWSEANHRLVLVHSWDTTHLGNVFGLASMMLASGGETSYSTSNGCYSTCEVWYPEYTTAQQLGGPIGSYTTLPNGVWERWFQNGVVLVNGTANTIPTFSLGGGTYTGSGLTSVSSVSMAPATGLILLADSGNTMSAPANTAAPAISGTTNVGAKLTANAGSWSGTPAPNFTYQWSRCTSASASSCTPISGATGSTYTLQSADAGDYIDVSVTATNPAGSASAVSTVTSQVMAPTFAISMSPSSRTIARGQYTWASANISQLNGFTSRVTLSLSGVPAGVTASFNYTTVYTLSALNVWTTTAAKPGTYTITVTATGGGQTKTTTFTLTLT